MMRLQCGYSWSKRASAKRRRLLTTNSVCSSTATPSRMTVFPKPCWKITESLLTTVTAMPGTFQSSMPRSTKAARGGEPADACIAPICRISRAVRSRAVLSGRMCMAVFLRFISM